MAKKERFILFLCVMMCGGAIFSFPILAQEKDPSVVNAFMSALEATKIYEEPKAESSILGEIEKGGQILALTVTATGWYQILYQGKTAYVQADCFQERTVAEELKQEIEDIAEAQETFSDEEIKNLVEGGFIQEGPVYEKSMQEKEAAGEKQQRLLTMVIICVLTVVVVLSGIGYSIVRRKELRDEPK